MTQSDKANAAAERAPSPDQPLISTAEVVGWNVDADPDNDPVWPMRDRAGDDGPGMNWTPPPSQIAEVEILQSVEHMRRPAVVGESTPPRGLSGLLRRAAFRFSESQWGHWLLLILADRVDTVEGLLGDVVSGRPPNPLVEMGMVKRAHARQAAVATAAVAVGVAALTLWAVRRRR